MFVVLYRLAEDWDDGVLEFGTDLRSMETLATSHDDARAIVLGTLLNPLLDETEHLAVQIEAVVRLN